MSTGSPSLSHIWIGAILVAVLLIMGMKTLNSSESSDAPESDFGTQYHYCEHVNGVDRFTVEVAKVETIQGFIQAKGVRFTDEQGNSRSFMEEDQGDWKCRGQETPELPAKTSGS